MINAVLIGVQKAGTTSVYDWLSQHPEIYAPFYLKDVPIFLKGNYDLKNIIENENLKNKNYKTFLSGYVGYLYKASISAENIKNFDQDAKLILILRDPINRVKSAYKYAVQRGLENRDISTALRTELLKEYKYDEEVSFQMDYINQSLYSNSLKVFLNFFEEKQIFIGTYEEMVKDKEKFIKSLFEFLGVNPKFKPEFSYKNKTEGGYRFKIINKLIYNRYYYPNNSFLKAIKSVIPLKVKYLIAKKLSELNTKKVEIDTTINPQIENKLKKIFREDIKELEKLTGKNFSEIWKF